MLRLRFLYSVPLAVLLTIQCNSAQCQEKQETSVVDQMYDLPGSMFFMQSVNSSQEHVDNAITDFLGSKFPMDVGQHFPDGMNRDRPVIFYKFDGTYTEVSQLPFESRKDIVDMSKDKIGEASDLTTPFEIDDPVIGDFPLFGGIQPWPSH